MVSHAILYLMKVVTVIPLSQGAYKEDLTYFTSQDVTAGTIVAVPIRKKIVDAVVVSTEHLTSSKIAVKESAFALKKIHAIKGPLPFYNEFWNAVVDAKTYHLGTTGAALYAIVPKLFFDEHESLPPYKERVITKDAMLAQEKLALMRPYDERIGLYKTLIRESFAKKQSLYICLPTVRDAEHFYEELKKGVEEHIYCFHSEVPPKATLTRYAKALANEHPIVIIGTASYLCIPRHDIATIIIERETSSAYRQIARPYVDMRVFAEMLSRRLGAKLIFADTYLRTETVHRTEIGEISEMSHFSYHLSRGIHRQIVSTKRTEDEREQKKPYRIISTELAQSIKEATDKGERAFLFTLRKGLAPITQCSDCEHVLQCERCASPLVLYKETVDKRIFSCNKCGDKVPSLMLCPICKGWKLTPLGVGTESVADEAARLFPKAKLFIVDKEHTKTAKQVKKIVDDYYATPGSILVGTELALLHLTEKVDTVAITSFDSLFSVPSFRIGEKIISLVARLEEMTKKHFILQTKNTDEPIIRDIISGNLAEAYKNELAIRKTLNFPPFSTFIKLGVATKLPQPEALRDVAQAIVTGMNAELFAPTVHKTKTGYTAHIAIRVGTDMWSPDHVIKKPEEARIFATKVATLGPAYNAIVDPDDLG